MADGIKRITFVTAVNAYSGYGNHGLRIVRDLEKLANCHVAIRPICLQEPFGVRVPDDIKAKFVIGPQPEDWEIILNTPNFIPTPGKKTAYFTMWESTKLPPAGVVALNLASVVIVPNQFNADCFSACGVTAPIRVVPLGIDDSVFKFSVMRTDHHDHCLGLKPSFVFGAAGRMSHGGVRKGINEVIDLFRKAFPDTWDVVLKVKVHPDCPVNELYDPRIQITKAHLPDEELFKWLHNIDCFVSAARCEGWGLFQHQSMTVGRPVISVKYGGLAEFFDDGNGFVVKHKLMPAQNYYAGLGNWAEPDEENFMEKMRYAYANRNEVEKIGVTAAQDVLHLTWNNHSLKLIEVLKEFGAI